jgi:hypothetical protein
MAAGPEADSLRCNAGIWLFLISGEERIDIGEMFSLGRKAGKWMGHGRSFSNFEMNKLPELE